MESIPSLYYFLPLNELILTKLQAVEIVVKKLQTEIIFTKTASKLPQQYRRNLPLYSFEK